MKNLLSLTMMVCLWTTGSLFSPALAAQGQALQEETERISVTVNVKNYYGAPGRDDFYVTFTSTLPKDSRYGYTDGNGQVTLDLIPGATYEANTKEDSYGNGASEFMTYQKTVTITDTTTTVTLDLSDGYLHEIQLATTGLSADYHHSYYVVTNLENKQSLRLHHNEPTLPVLAYLPDGRYRLEVTNHLGTNYQDSGDQLPALQQMEFAVSGADRTVTVDYAPWQSLTYNYAPSEELGRPYVSVFKTYGHQIVAMSRSSMQPRDTYFVTAINQLPNTQVYFLFGKKVDLSQQDGHVQIPALDTLNCSRIDNEEVTFEHLPSFMDTASVSWKTKNVDYNGIYTNSQYYLTPGEHFFNAIGDITVQGDRYTLLYHGFYTVADARPHKPVADLEDYRLVRLQTASSDNELPQNEQWYNLFIYDEKGQLYEQIAGKDITMAEDHIEGRFVLPIGTYTVREVYKTYIGNELVEKVRSTLIHVSATDSLQDFRLDMVDEPTGIRTETAASTKLSLTRQGLYVEMPDCPTAELRIYDTGGRCCLRQTVRHGQTIPLDRLSRQQVYVAYVKQADGSLTRLKFIIRP